MQHDYLKFHVDGEIAILTLDNPSRRHPLDRGTQLAMLRTLESLRDAPEIRALVLTATGQAFCSGADLAGNAIMSGDERLTRGQVARKAMEERSNRVVATLRELPIPVVTALPGVAAGAGVGLALSADIVIAARSAYFYLPFVPKLGLLPDLGATWFLEMHLGRARATAMTLLGTRIGAEQAERWGLVWACVDDDLLQQEALAIARQLAKLPSRSVVEVRRAFDSAARNELLAQLQYEAERQGALIDRPEFEEGVRAFREKREPEFTKPAEGGGLIEP